MYPLFHHSYHFFRYGRYGKTRGDTRTGTYLGGSLRVLLGPLHRYNVGLQLTGHPHHPVQSLCHLAKQGKRGEGVEGKKKKRGMRRREERRKEGREEEGGKEEGEKRERVGGRRGGER